MARVSTLPEMWRPLMGRPSVRMPWCPVCGRPGPLEQHHPVRRGAGVLYDEHGREVAKPTITLCGFGSNLQDADGRPYCHGLAHHNRLHFRWAETRQASRALGDLPFPVCGGALGVPAPRRAGGLPRGPVDAGMAEAPVRWAEPWHTPQDAARRREAWAWACEHGTCGDCAHAAWCPGTDVGICRLRAEERDIDECWVEPGLRARDMECGYEPDYEYDEEG